MPEHRIGTREEWQAARDELASLEAELQRAQPAAQAVWKATARCTDVTLPESGQACAPILGLRQALGQAQRCEALDLELRKAKADLVTLPAVTVADPQAETAAR